MNNGFSATLRAWVAAGLLVAASSQAVGADGTSVQRGNELYQYWCATCHGAGPGMLGPGTLPGTHALALRYKGAVPAVLEERKDLTEVLVKTVVRKGIVAMPFFRRTEISDADLDAIVAYLTRNSAK